MDNIENNSNPLGEAGATASQGQLDANDTQPVEDTQPISDGEVAETGQASNPWDNDPKFKGKAPDEIYKAYKEVEKLSGQLSRKAEIANLIEEKFGVSPDQLKAQIEHQEAERKRQLYASNPLAPLADKVAEQEKFIQQMQQEKALQEQEKELDNFIKNNPEMSQHRDKLLRLALTDGIGFDSDTGEEKSYEDLAREWIGEVRAQGQQDAYKKIETKKETQATGSVSTPKKSITLDDMKNMSAAELRQILPHAPVRP